MPVNGKPDFWDVFDEAYHCLYGNDPELIAGYILEKCDKTDIVMTVKPTSGRANYRDLREFVQGYLDAEHHTDARGGQQ